MKIKLFVIALGFIFLSSCSLMNKKNVDHGWITNLEEGLEYAKKEKKAVFTLFTGSDWCRPCKNLESQILSSEEFEKYASENLILVKMDFPRRPQNKLEPAQKKYNNELKRKYNVRGFLSVILLDKEGNELERWVGYRSTNLDEMIKKYSAALSK